MKTLRTSHCVWMICGMAALLAGAATAHGEEAVQSRARGDVYMLDTCPVTGNKLGEMGPPVVKEYEGREVRFCCNACPAKFEANPAEYWKKIDAAIIAQQKPLYPLDTCVVSGEKLGGMGEPVDYVYKNRLVRLCCSGCIDPFKKDPAKYLAKLNQAVLEKQKASYPLDKCVVLGNKITDANAVNYVAGNRLIRFCCQGCVEKFEKDPLKYLPELKK